MMKKHYELGRTPDEVKMPFENSGMMVDRKPAQTRREPSDFSGINLDPPKVAARPAPPEFTINPPQYPPTTRGIGSISKPQTSRKLGGVASAGIYLGAFAGLAYVTYKAATYLSDGDDDE